MRHDLVVITPGSLPFLMWLVIFFCFKYALIIAPNKQKKWAIPSAYGWEGKREWWEEDLEREIFDLIAVQSVTVEHPNPVDRFSVKMVYIINV